MHCTLKQSYYLIIIIEIYILKDIYFFQINFLGTIGIMLSHSEPTVQAIWHKIHLGLILFNNYSDFYG